MTTNALYYPFHLCHKQTLQHLLQKYQVLHFRKFMALQLTPMLGMVALSDQMGHYYPELLKTGRIVQGYDISGSMPQKVNEAVDYDLSDRHWRSLFHKALLNDYRFQRGLIHESRLPSVETPTANPSARLYKFSQPDWAEKPFQVETVKNLSRWSFIKENEVGFEYGWALIKTSAALVYTIRLCQILNVGAVTDSISHYKLLERTCKRDGVKLQNSNIKREGY